jgi:uncharacterized protein (TIGR02996 family)
MTTEVELLAQIYADPIADGPRLVYADFLQERGDPRGELIALQILHRDTSRERELLREHARTWLGPLADVIDLRPDAQTTFERGFLAIAEIARTSAARLPEVVHDPAWATVEEVRGWDAHVVLGAAPLVGLRRLEAMLPVDRLDVLARRPTPLPNLVELAVASFGRFTPAQRDVLAECAGLPGLRELVIAANWTIQLDDVLWLLETPVAARLDRLVVRRPGRPRRHDGEERRAVEAIATVLERTRATASSVGLTTPDAPIELVRGPDGLYARVR